MLAGRRSTLAGVLATLALALGLVACGGGGDGGGEPAPAPQEVSVVADEYKFEPSTDFQGGPTAVSLENQGEEQHELLLVKINEGFTFDEAIEAEGEEGTTEMVGIVPPVNPGETGAKPIEGDLKPGKYGMVCTLPAKTAEGKDKGKPHVLLGQRLEFDVE